MTNDAGKLAYKSGGADAGKLAYKKAGSSAGSLVYKIDLGGETLITFGWSSDGSDLDICAYWDGADSLKVGYGYNSSSGEYLSGAHRISYSGDVRGTNTAEWVKIGKRPWSGAPASFTVRLNFFGHSSTYPADKCSVIAAQANGVTKVLFDVPCGTNGGSNTPRPANDSDPGVRLYFDSTGFLEKMETIN